jgi:hypothetical protein
MQAFGQSALPCSCQEWLWWVPNWYWNLGSEGRLRDEFDAVHFERVALHLQFTPDFYLLADESFGSLWSSNL